VPAATCCSSFRFYLALCGSASAQRRGGSSSHSKTHSSSSKSSAAKTVHVRSYTKKDGTVVKSYDRRPAGSKENVASPHPTVGSSASPALRDSNGRIQRKAAAKEAFERQTGYPHGRPGYVVDHIKPLACGGADDPSNMQWQTIANAKAKDKVERQGCK